MSAQIWMLICITFLMLGAAALVVMIQQARKLTVRKEDFTTGDRAPLRFALISDLHISKMPIHWDYICTNISKVAPDFVVVAGDLVFSKKDGPTVLSFFRLLADYTECPIYVTYGNHDNNKLFCRDTGLKRAFTNEIESISSKIHVIEDKNIVYTVNGRSVVLCGLSDFGTGDPEGAEERLRAASELADKMSASVLLVSHNADILLKLPERCADLAVFGHFHDGQVHLPGRAEFRVLRRHDILACRGYIYGRYVYNGTPVYITSGLGNTNLAIRYGSVPEIALITF